MHEIFLSMVLDLKTYDKLYLLILKNAHILWVLSIAKTATFHQIAMSNMFANINN